MAWSGWCTEAEVRQRVRQATAGDGGWEDTDIQARVDEAMDVLKTALRPRYGADQVTLWDTAETKPALITHLTAAQAAVYVYRDGWAQSPENPDMPGGVLQAWVDKTLAQLFACERYLELDGEIIKMIDSGLSDVYSTTSEKEATLTLGERMQDRTKPGSLDYMGGQHGGYRP